MTKFSTFGLPRRASQRLQALSARSRMVEFGETEVCNEG